MIWTRESLLTWTLFFNHVISGFGAPSGSQGMTTSPFRAASMLSGNGYFANVGLKAKTKSNFKMFSLVLQLSSR